MDGHLSLCTSSPIFTNNSVLCLWGYRAFSVSTSYIELSTAFERQEAAHTCCWGAWPAPSHAMSLGSERTLHFIWKVGWESAPKAGNSCMSALVPLFALVGLF